MMLRRRKLLAGLGWGVIATYWPRAASAATESVSHRRDHCSFMQEMQSRLDGAVERGEAGPEASSSAVCPLCGDRVTVSVH